MQMESVRHIIDEFSDTPELESEIYEFNCSRWLE